MKSKTFRSNASGTIAVAVPGHGVITFKPGNTVETDDPAVVAAFVANSDLSEVKGSKKK